MKYGCIGEHLSHSFSLEIHERLSGEAYELAELSPAELGAFFERRDFCGINVTIPYKTAVIPYLDALDDTAKAVGSVNTVIHRNGKLVGYNTDSFGLSALLSRTGVPLSGKTVLITGTGGTSKTAKALAKESGARRVLCVSRTAGRGDLTYDELPSVAGDVDVIFQATPAGMYPNDEERLFDLSLFPRLQLVLDVIYHPNKTNLVLDAEARGIPAVGGLYMLVAQAWRSAELFHGVTYDAGKIDEIYREILKEKENLVLVGMPGCGKSLVGARIAKRLGRNFFDTDAEVERRACCSVADIFGAQGEDAFRRLEGEVVRDLSPLTGVVIATGGGTPLRGENLWRLRRNGRICFLDRPREALTPTADRPLSQSEEALSALYSARIDRYRAMADITIPVGGSADDTAATLEMIWRKE